MRLALRNPDSDAHSMLTLERPPYSSAEPMGISPHEVAVPPAIADQIVTALSETSAMMPLLAARWQQPGRMGAETHVHPMAGG